MKSIIFFVIFITTTFSPNAQEVDWSRIGKKVIKTSLFECQAIDYKENNEKIQYSLRFFIDTLRDIPSYREKDHNFATLKISSLLQNKRKTALTENISITEEIGKGTNNAVLMTVTGDFYNFYSAFLFENKEPVRNLASFTVSYDLGEAHPTKALKGELIAVDLKTQKAKKLSLDCQKE